MKYSTKQLKKLRRFRCFKYERDEQIETISKGGAGSAIVAISQIFVFVCLVKHDPAWKAFLSLVLGGIASLLFNAYSNYHEKPWLYVGIAFMIPAIVLGICYILI